MANSSRDLINDGNFLISETDDERSQYVPGRNISISAKSRLIPGDNVEIIDYEISGRDWTPEIDAVHAWKKWSEEHGSTGSEGSLYMGTDNDATSGGIAIGNENIVTSAYSNGYVSTYDAAIALGSANSAVAAVAIGHDNTAAFRSTTFGHKNSATNISITLGDSNSAQGNATAFGEANKVDNNSLGIGRNNIAEGGATAMGESNSAKYNGITIGQRAIAEMNSMTMGFDIKASGSPSTFIIGDGINANNTTGNYVFGTYNNLTGNYDGWNYLVGNNNGIAGAYNYLFGQQNSVSGWRNYVMGYQNVFGEGVCDRVVLGWNNILSGNNSLYGFVAGYSNKLSGFSQDFIIGGDNTISADHGAGLQWDDYVFGSNNSAKGAYIVGFSNNVNDGYAFGFHNSAVEGAHIFGRNSYGQGGSFTVGDSNSAWGGSVAVMRENYVTGGSVAIGDRNSATYGSYAIGKWNRAENGGIALGENVLSDNGDVHIGKYILTSADNTYIFGNQISGKFGDGSTVIGNGITGNDNSYSNNLVFAANSNVFVDNGSILIKNINYVYDQYGNSNVDTRGVVSAKASTVIGRYAGNSERRYYAGSGINAEYGGYIIGEGMNISAINDAYIFGNESIAKYGSMILGHHGYAESDSMVINSTNMTYQRQRYNFNFNDLIRPSNRYYLLSETNVYDYYGQNVTKQTISNISLTGETSDYDNCTRIFHFYHINGNYSVAAFCFPVSQYVSYNGVYGYWSDEKTFIEGGSNYAYRIKASNYPNAMVMVNDNGTVSLKSLADLANSSGYVYFSSMRSNDISYSQYMPRWATDGTYLYEIIDKKRSGYDTDIPTGLRNGTNWKALDNTNRSVTVIKKSYYDGSSNIPYSAYMSVPSAVSATTITVFPSAVLPPGSAMFCNSFAQYGSIVIGPKSCAQYGAAAINLPSYYDNGPDQNGGTCYTASKRIFDNYGNLIENDYGAFAQYGSFALKFGTNTNGENVSAQNGSMAVGHALSADYGSIAIGFNGSSADAGSLLFGKSTTAKYGALGLGFDGVYSEGGSVALGARSCSALYGSMALGTENIIARAGSFVFGPGGMSADGGAMALGLRSVYAYNGGLGIGFQGATAKDSSIAIGFQSISATSESIAIGNRSVYTSGAPSFAMGSQGVTASAGGFAFGVNGITATNTQGFAIGYNGIGATQGGAFAIGKNTVGAYNTYGFAIGCNNVCAYNGGNFAIGTDNVHSFKYSFAIGYNNISAEQDSFAIGTNNVSACGKAISIGSDTNIAKYKSLCVGFSNSGANDALLIGHYNEQRGTYYTTNSPIFNAFGRSNSVVDSTEENEQYDMTMIGNYNRMTLSAYVGPNPFGIMLGGSNYLEGYNIGGYNVMIGYNNRSRYEAVALGSRNDVFSHSIALGWGNVATADNYGSASNNYYPHAIMLGYNNYAKDDVSAKYSLSAKTGNPETNSLLVGTSNTAYHYNSYLFGSRNISLAPTTNVDNDDGFVLAFGLNNTVGRNYDIAIGYSALASGGENIAIGAPQVHDDYPTTYTRALGFKNIAIRSDISGANNIAIDSIGNTIVAGPFHENAGNTYKNMVNSVLTAGILTDNNIRDVDSTIITLDMYLCKTTLNNLTGTNIHGINMTRNDIAHDDRNTYTVDYFSDNIIRYTRYNAVSAAEMHKNILWKVSTAGLTANKINDNIILGIGDNNYNYDEINVRLDQLQNNIIRKSSIINTFAAGKDYGAVDMNFALNSVISISGNYGSRGISCGPIDWDTHQHVGHVSNSFLVGTVTMGSIGECVSFGSNDSNWHVTNTNGVYRMGETDQGWGHDAPILQHVNQAFNFGDNQLINASQMVLMGYGNEIFGASKGRVFGSNNGIVSNCRIPTCSGWLSDSDNIMETTVVGQCNFVGQLSGGGYGRTKNTLFGEGNALITYGENNEGIENPYVSNNILLGTYNGILEVSDDLIHDVIRDGIYNQYIDRDGYIKRPNILPPTDTTYYDGTRIGQVYSAYALSGRFCSRNVIIGSHSVIASDINDSIMLGNSNAAVSMNNDLRVAQLTYLTNNAEQWQSGKENYASGYCKYNNNLYHSSYLWNLTATPPNNSSWDLIGTPRDIPLVCHYSNNFAAGAYNLLLAGSNQVLLGTNCIVSGYNATAVGEGLIAQTSQMVVGRFNEVLEGTNGISADDIDSTTGALFVVGNGRHIFADYAVSGIERSNAMIVSADGTVSAKRFIEAEPALTITGGNGITVTEDTANNKLIIDLESSLGQMVTELSAVLTNKPTTGRHLLGVDNGTLTWLEVNQ